MDGTIRLADYRAYPFTIDHVALTFRLSPGATRVKSLLHMAPTAPNADLHLDGEELSLISLAINDSPLNKKEYSVTPTGLTIAASAVPTTAFTLSCEVEIAPNANTALEGLYMSNGMYCTQCEAEGFRKITYYPDRPDVMARFHVRIEGDLPVLLSNGNPAGKGEGWAEWDDPWPKPAYLFALVAGDLVATSGCFTTRSGRNVDLNIYVRPGDEDRCDFALESLKLSMQWDETAYGREYDLDLFNIVAVDDFNMGAMENKGLNIFNSKLVLASPETATDTDYMRIEAVIGHEYFHNWTGNRITCRDWFQLCLKEGLTVFRDQSFTRDVRLGPVKRIEDAATLRARQFREDQGPLAHPPRPDHYREINNFYTVTVYEKGAELVGMLKRLAGDDGYKTALDLYFDRHDGQACTIEDWLKVFEDTTGRNLDQFKLWYTSAGTPRLDVTEEWDGDTLTLTFTQSTAPTPGDPTKAPRHIPIQIGLLAPDGTEVVPTTLLEMTEATQSFHFPGLSERPTASILRDFSAPVMLARDLSTADLAFLLAHDTDGFNRWDAGHSLAKTTLIAMTTGADPSDDFLTAIGGLLADDSLDPTFLAHCLSLPSDDELAQAIFASGKTPDPDAIYVARADLARKIAQTHQTRLEQLYDATEVKGPYSPDAHSAGQRDLRRACLGLLSHIDAGHRAQALFDSASNMTDSLAALTTLIRHGRGAHALEQFRERWKDNRLVMDKWFMVQVGACPPKDAIATAQALAEDPLFDWKNPNRFRSLIGGLVANHAGFHAANGDGYAFLADWLIRLDPMNPQTAARMSTSFETWRRYDATRQAHIRDELTRISQTRGLSRDLSEMTQRLLG
ncbi:aminopeptidase N [Thioclava sp. SK-1]|uniref:aminopeptidase N n=1 Tax=Thioclava sp. SK-1 TaxID=1889770 RepID=UPI0008258355|nr:aminopeptidase N [Thioclava sp. SK-1]OCX66062.1 aminopeptidase N [Thioclava sp. SK-1]